VKSPSSQLGSSKWCDAWLRTVQDVSTIAQYASQQVQRLGQG
jgi:hypothetical protein